MGEGNTACKLEPKKCRQIARVELLARIPYSGTEPTEAPGTGGGHYSESQFRRFTMDAFKAHPTEWVRRRVALLPSVWFGAAVPAFGDQRPESDFMLAIPGDAKTHELVQNGLLLAVLAAVFALSIADPPDRTGPRRLARPNSARGRHGSRDGAAVRDSLFSPGQDPLHLRLRGTARLGASRPAGELIRIVNEERAARSNRLPRWDHGVAALLVIIFRCAAAICPALVFGETDCQWAVVNGEAEPRLAPTSRANGAISPRARRTSGRDASSTGPWRSG